MDARAIARARVIERLDLSKGKGVIVVGGKQFTVTFDDLLDLVRAVETIMWRTTGKLLRPQFRPEITNRKALAIDRLVGGDYTLYDATQGPAPVQAFNACEVTESMIKTHYLLVEIAGTRWDNWLGRLDELVKCLYIVVKEAQGDPFIPAPAIYLNREASSRAVTMTRMVGHG